DKVNKSFVRGAERRKSTRALCLRRSLESSLCAREGGALRISRAPAGAAAARRRGRRQVWTRSVLGLVDQAIGGDPGHHAAQLRPHLLDRMLGRAPAHRLEARLAGLAFLDPVASEAAGLDVVEN